MNDPMQFYWDETDYYHKAGPRKLSRWEWFMRYIMPWIVLAIICYLIYLFMEQIFYFIVYISEPVCKEVICKF